MTNKEKQMNDDKSFQSVCEKCERVMLSGESEETCESQALIHRVMNRGHKVKVEAIKPIREMSAA